MVLAAFVWLVLYFSSAFRLSEGPPAIPPRYFVLVWDVLAILTWDWWFSWFCFIQLIWCILHSLWLCLTHRWILGIVWICSVLRYCCLRRPLWEGPPLCRCRLFLGFIGFQFFPVGPSCVHTGISRCLKSTFRCSSYWGPSSSSWRVLPIILLTVLCFLGRL